MLPALPHILVVPPGFLSSRKTIERCWSVTSAIVFEETAVGPETSFRHLGPLFFGTPADCLEIHTLKAGSWSIRRTDLQAGESGKGRSRILGIEILDSYEERWAESESLSDRQIAWLEKQLDGTWRAVGSKSVPDAMVTTDPVPKDEAELLDVIVERRLEAQGKTMIDAGQIDRLRQAVKDLNSALGGLGD